MQWWNVVLKEKILVAPLTYFNNSGLNSTCDYNLLLLVLIDCLIDWLDKLDDQKRYQDDDGGGDDRYIMPHSRESIAQR